MKVIEKCSSISYQLSSPLKQIILNFSQIQNYCIPIEYENNHWTNWKSHRDRIDGLSSNESNENIEKTTVSIGKDKKKKKKLSQKKESMKELKNVNKPRNNMNNLLVYNTIQLSKMIKSLSQIGSDTSNSDSSISPKAQHKI